MLVVSFFTPFRFFVSNIGEVKYLQQLNALCTATGTNLKFCVIEWCLMYVVSGNREKHSALIMGKPGYILALIYFNQGQGDQHLTRLWCCTSTRNPLLCCFFIEFEHVLAFGDWFSIYSQYFHLFLIHSLFGS